MIAAVIGIGSNSIRLLVADVAGDRACMVCREREGNRLFAGLDAGGRLRAESIRQTVDTAAAMADCAMDRGAEAIWVFATSAVRDAVNGGELARQIQQRLGVQLEICSGQEEASLSFLGATDGGFTGVIDIGGGSTEVITGKGMDILSASSSQMGAVRLFRRLPVNGAQDLPAVVDCAKQILTDTLKLCPIPSMPNRWIGTGGTFTTLAAMKLSVDWSRRTRIHGVQLSRSEVSGRAAELADMPLSERLKIPGLQPKRADIIVHGIAILQATMETLCIDEIRVSEYGNLDGYLKRRYHLAGCIC